jgi:hypothetical protein
MVSSRNDIQNSGLTVSSEVKGLTFAHRSFQCLRFSFPLATGLVFGLLVFNFTDEWNPKQTWPTVEMNVRGQFRTVLVGALIALPSGAAVAISLLSGNQSSLVGVAISASLLPPCVNTGLLWAFALVKLIRAYGTELYGNSRASMYATNQELAPMQGYDWTFSSNMAIECALLGLVSLLLALVNVVCIYLSAYLLLKIKEVMPLLSFAKSPKQRFWSEHVKIARNYRRASNSVAPESLGKELLEEWAVCQPILNHFNLFEALLTHSNVSLFKRKENQWIGCKRVA